MDSAVSLDGVKVVGYLPELYKHLAASDIAIVTGGGTVTLELTALEKPFLYFPLEKDAPPPKIISCSIEVWTYKYLIARSYLFCRFMDSYPFWPFRSLTELLQKDRRRCQSRQL